MPIVKVYIPIRNGYHGGSTLLERNYDMDFLPDVGDVLHVLKNDPDSGLTFEIYRRWWDENGKTILDVAQTIIDPEPSGVLPSRWNGWISERDGDLVAMLLANGWTEFGVESPARKKT